MNCWRTYRSPWRDWRLHRLATRTLHCCLRHRTMRIAWSKTSCRAGAYQASEIATDILLRADGHQDLHVDRWLFDGHDNERDSLLIRGDDHFAKQFRPGANLEAMGWESLLRSVSMNPPAMTAQLSKRHGALSELAIARWVLPGP